MNETPLGTLTGAQLEIVETVWRAGGAGASVTEIWQHLNGRRPVARTTVLTMVGRLAKKGWLIRRGSGRSHRYFAAQDPSVARATIASRFIDEFFGGSANGLVRSLLGSRRIGAAEARRLRDLLERPSGAHKK